MDLGDQLLEAARAKGIGGKLLGFDEWFAAARAREVAATLTAAADTPVAAAHIQLDRCPFELPGDADHGRPYLSLIEGRPTQFICIHPRCNHRSIAALAEKLGVTLPTAQDTFKCLTAKELDDGDFTIRYLVDEVLAALQTCFIAGGFKTLKTSVMLDLAIALTTLCRFLGVVPVLKQCRVLFMSGESGSPVLQDTARRICKARGLKLGDIDGLIFSDELPQLDDPDALNKLSRTIAEHCADVLMVDPLYLCFGGDDHSNIFKQGPLLRSIQRACRDAGVTPVLAHHNTKAAAKKHTPPQLEDMSMAGFAEFAAQWLLLGRREPYQPGEPHALWLNVGGRAGHSTLYRLDIDEGSRPHRKWDVTIGNGYASLESDRLAKWSDKVLANLAKGPLPTSHATKGITSTADQQAVLNHLIELGKIRVASEKIEKKKTVTYYEAAA